MATTWSASPSPAADPGARLTPGQHAARLLATAGGLGYAPIAPGTVASLPVALLIWLAAPGDVWLGAAALVVTGLGIWASHVEARRVEVKDPSSVVVDEVAGMLVALVAQPRSLRWVLVLFVLFRVMDVWKPFPIRQLQALPGGLGIVVDDLLAGVYASALGSLARWLFERA
jgi:phosphatidylglycerophosphatase A